MPSRRDRIAAIAATADYNPEEAAVAQAMLDRMPTNRLEVIATDIKAEYGKGMDAQFAIGRLLSEAWELFRGSKVEYGRWFATQGFEFHRNTGQLLRLAAEREREVRDYIAAANDPQGSHRDIGVNSAIKELLSGKVRGTQAKPDVENLPEPTPADPAFAAFRAGAHKVLGWEVGEDGTGRATDNAFMSMHVDDLRESAALLTAMVSAYQGARRER